MKVNRFFRIVSCILIVCFLVSYPTALAAGNGEVKIPQKPTSLNAKVTSLSTAELSWKGDAESYLVYVGAAGDGYSLYAAVNKEACKVTGLDSTRKYCVLIKGINKKDSVDEKRSPYSDAYTFSTFGKNVVKASRLPDSSSYSGIKWNAVKGAQSYTVYRSPYSNKGFKAIATVKTTSYQDKSAGVNVKYYYKVRANRKVSGGSYTTALSNSILQYKRLPAMSSVRAVPGYGNITFSWKKASGATYYQIFRSTKLNGTYDYIIGTYNDWARDETIKDNVTYYYKFRTVTVKDGFKYYGVTSSPVKLSGVKLDPKRPVIALTFDDGPGTKSTKRIVDVLEKYHCRGTFFSVGYTINDKTRKDLLCRERNIGCEMGNHSYNHPSMKTLSDSEIKAQFAKTNKIIKDATGMTPKVARLPYGSNNARVLAAMDMPCIQWDIDTEDWKSHNPSMIYSRVVGKVKDGQFLLFHDIHDTTATAVENIIPVLVKQGYQFVTVSELARYRKVTLKPGKLYYALYK